MKLFVTLAAMILTLSVAVDASAHGFRIQVDANHKLKLYTDDPTAGGQLIYKSSFLGPAASKSYDHPGFDVDLLDGPSGFFGGETIEFDVLSKLWYSTGSGSATPSLAGVNLVITPQDLSTSLTVTGSSGFQTGFSLGEYDGDIIGAYEHQLVYGIDFAPSVPIGAYAIAMRLRGTDSNDVPFTTSDTFVAVWNNGLTSGTFNTVAPQLFAAAVAVPEPSGVVLASLSALGLLAFRRRASRISGISS